MCSLGDLWFKALNSNSGDFPLGALTKYPIYRVVKLSIRDFKKILISSARIQLTIK